MGLVKIIAVRLLAASALFGSAFAGEPIGEGAENASPLFFSQVAPVARIIPDKGMTCKVQTPEGEIPFLTFGGKFIREEKASPKGLIYRFLTVKWVRPCNFSGKTLTFEYRIRGPVQNITIRGASKGETVFLYSNWGKQFDFWRLVDLEMGMSCDYFHLKLPMGDISAVDTLQISLGLQKNTADAAMDIRRIQLVDSVF